MKKTAIAFAFSALITGTASAQTDSHWVNSAGELVRNSSDECVRTINHQQSGDAVACHGAQVKRQIPAAPVEDLAAKKRAMEEEARRRAAAAAAAAAKIAQQKKILQSLKHIKLAAGASFTTGSAVLSAAGRTELDNLATKLQQIKKLDSVTVSGYTDSSGSEAFNQRLSQKRADAVKAYLQSRGIDGSKIQSIGYGETNPIASNQTAAGRTKNRRVEIKVDGEVSAQ